MVSSSDERVQTIRMDNLGFQDPHHHSNSKRLGRSVSVNAEVVESHPLYINQHQSSTVPRWRRSQHHADPMAMLEEQYPSDDYDYEYMECGPSPPADHIHNPYYESLEEVPTHELSVQICHDTIRNNLVDHMKSSSGMLSWRLNNFCTVNVVIFRQTPLLRRDRTQANSPRESGRVV